MHESLSNTIDYVEMPTRNLTETKRFFSGLWGWSFQDYGPDYSSFDDGRMAGGFFTADKTAGVDSGGVLVVFYHPDLAKILSEVKRLGGEVIREIFEFPGGRRFHFREPGGGEFAVWSEK
jgi:predicted enzyme related to lactoylglutathione lyase